MRSAPPRSQNPPRPSRLEGAGSALLWGGSGFLIGAIFWHFIGFWGFVSTVVLGDQESKRHAQEGSGNWVVRIFVPPSRIGGAAARRGPVVGAACTTLVLDRGRGLTANKPCPPILPTVPAAAAAKADRLPSPFDADETAAATVADATEAATVRQAPAETTGSPSRIETLSVKLPTAWTVETRQKTPPH